MDIVILPLYFNSILMTVCCTQGLTVRCSVLYVVSNSKDLLRKAYKVQHICRLQYIKTSKYGDVVVLVLRNVAGTPSLKFQYN